MEITREIASKVLEVVDAGLVNGVGEPEPGKMCVEAAVCYALGLPHGDDPQCVSRALRGLKIRLNDSQWSSNEARTKGLRRLAVAQLGSRDVLDDKEFVRRVVDLAIRKQVPIALHAAASVHPDSNHKAKLLDAASRCEKEGTEEAAQNARDISRAAAAAAYAAAAADADAYAAAAAYAYAVAVSDAYAAAAAYAVAVSDAYAAAAAYAVAVSDAYAAAAAARDKVLSDFAEDVVQILKDMDAPGCQWLELTDAVAA